MRRPTSSGCEEAAATMLLAPIRRRTIGEEDFLKPIHPVKWRSPAGLRLCRATRFSDYILSQTVFDAHERHFGLVFALLLCCSGSVQHDVEIHILGVSASVGEAKDKECVLIEVVMHITSKDPYGLAVWYVTLLHKRLDPDCILQSAFFVGGIVE